MPADPMSVVGARSRATSVPPADPRTRAETSGSVDSPPRLRPLTPAQTSGTVDSPPRPRRPPLGGCDHRELGEVLGDAPARGVLLVGDLPSTSLRGHHQWLARASQEHAAGRSSPNRRRTCTRRRRRWATACSSSARSGSWTSTLPDLVLTAGLFGLSRPTMELLRRAGRHVALELPSVGREVCDPLRTADEVLRSIPLPPSAPDPDPAWLGDWRAADAVAADVVARVVTHDATDGAGQVDTGGAGSSPLTGSAVAARPGRRHPATPCCSWRRPGRSATSRRSPGVGPAFA